MPLAKFSAMWPEWGYDGTLLTIARHFIDSRQPADLQAAVVFAQMACEVSTEGAFATILEKRELRFLCDPISDLIPNCNLGNERVRKLYVAFSGDNIQEAGFWSEFKNHVKRRNDVVHGGKQVTKGEAEASCSVTRQLIDHLKSHLSSL